MVRPSTGTAGAEPAAGRPRPTPDDAFRLARRRWLAPARIDMGALADELGVNRVTLYRWVGSRDDLLVEVVWQLAGRSLAQADDEARARGASGAERIVATVTGFLEIVIASPGLQRWLAEEGEHAMRLLTRHDTRFQPRLIDAIHERLREEDDAGRLALGVEVDLHEVAYVIVRLIESYTYLDLITGERPDARRAEPILRLLLR
jgi:AcrR family transcriptional regulator